MPLRAMLRTKRQRFDAVPTASGGVARAAYRRARKARIAVEPLLKRAGLTMQQAKNAAVRIGVANQIQFLNLVADELRDEFLGFHLAQKIDLRELGLLYYVLASSETLGDALRRVARSSTIQNEGVRIRFSEGRSWPPGGRPDCR
jgi:hypothetical protein